MSDQFKRILAIDYGTVRVGLAVSDPLGLFATPLVTLPNNGDLFVSIIRIINKFDVKKIILGYPLKENGDKSSSTLSVEKFRIALEQKINIPIIFVDERYSSTIAMDRIIETVKSKKKRRNKGLVDKFAAAVILEDFLKENN